MPPKRRSHKGKGKGVSSPARNTRSKTKSLPSSSRSEEASQSASNAQSPPSSSPRRSFSADGSAATHTNTGTRSAQRFDAGDRGLNDLSTPSRRITILTPPTTRHRPSKRQSRGDHGEAEHPSNVVGRDDHDDPEEVLDDSDGSTSLDHNGDDHQPSRACHPPNPWMTGHVEHSIVPDLEPHTALKAVKLFIDTHQATRNLETARDLVAGLDDPPTWSTRAGENVLVLVEMIFPDHVVIASDALGRLERSRPDHMSANSQEREDVERDEAQQSVEKDAAATKRRKKTLVEAWWGRFLRLKIDGIRGLPPSVEEMLTQDASETLNSLYLHDTDMSTEVAQPTAERQQQMLCTRILFMYNRDMASSIHMIMHIFFYAIMYHPDPNRWRIDVKARKDRSAKLSSRDIDRLYDNFVDQFPDVAITRESFGIQLKEWRRLGSVYLYFARRLGLGSLLYLQAWILPSKCWGATRGGEQSGASNTALQHLEDIGIPELCEESGANRCVRRLLEYLCQGFGTFNFGDLDS